MLRSTRYTGIPDRVTDVDQVKQELQALVDAQPTQIHPDDREGYLSAILADLRPDEGSIWTSWPEEALTAIRILGRNPMGSNCMLTTPSISTLLFHSGLIPHQPGPMTRSQEEDGPLGLLVDARSVTAIEALKVLANLLVLHPIARKRVARADGCRGVVRALAGKNTARPATANSNVGASDVQDGGVGAHSAGDSTEDVYFLGNDTPERVFLLARLLFLMTAGDEGLARAMVDEEGFVDALVHHFLNLPPVPIHYDALTELFKAANIIIAAYSADKTAWTDTLNPLVHAAMIHLHLTPLHSLAPPLTQIVHVLFSTPLNSHTSLLFASAPDIAPGSPTIAFSALTLGAPAGISGAAEQVQSGMRTLFNKIGQLPGQIRGMAGGPSAGEEGTGHGAGAGAGAGVGAWAGLGLSGVPATGEGNASAAGGTATTSPDRPKTLRERMSFSSGRPSLASLSPPQLTGALPPTTSTSRRPSGSGTTAHPTAATSPRARTTSSPRLPLPLPTMHPEPLALPRRIFLLLQDWMDRYLPSTTSPDSELYSRTAIDEVLPPLLLLLVKASQNNDEGRTWLKEQLLPQDLDRSEGAGTLESRQGTLGGLLRLMGCTRFPSSRAAAGELIWVICGRDAAIMSAEIGYGNAAGFLFHKGITQPPAGTITEMDEDPQSPSTSATTSPADIISPTRVRESADAKPDPALTTAEPRHPITSLLPNPSLVASHDLSNMTPEEKEREAEKLFVLFQRMERNPVLSLGAETETTPNSNPDDPAITATPSSSTSEQGKGKGKGKVKGIEELMRQKLATGEHARMDEQDEVEERKRREKEEEKDEEEVGREMAQYRARMSR